MPYDSNKGYYYEGSFPADTRPDDWPAEEPDEPEEEEPEPLDTLDSLERVLADSRGLPTLSEERERLQAELEASLDMARKIKGLELQIEVLTQALEEVKKVAAMKESYLFRHIATAANLGLNEAERIRGRK